jgi:ketosteroid isomerase-like protein
MHESTDHLAVAQVVNSYAAAVDAGDIEGVIKLFVPDGRLVGYFTAGQPDPDYDFVGIDAIRALEQRWQPYVQLWHFMGTHTSCINADGAKARSYCLAHHQLPGDTDIVVRVMSVIYEDDLVRTSTGWRLTRRTVRKLWSEDRRAAL